MRLAGRALEMRLQSSKAAARTESWGHEEKAGDQELTFSADWTGMAPVDEDNVKPSPHEPPGVAGWTSVDKSPVWRAVATYDVRKVRKSYSSHVKET